MHPRESRHAAEDGVVGSGEALGHLQEAEGDGDANADENAEDHGADEGGQREEDFAAPEGPEPTELVDFDELGRGIQDDGTERGLREVFHQGPGDKEDEDDAHGGHDGVHLAAGPARECECGA